MRVDWCVSSWFRIKNTHSRARHWARDWRALALTQVHHGSRLSDSREDGEALSSVHSTALAAERRKLRSQTRIGEEDRVHTCTRGRRHESPTYSNVVLRERKKTDNPREGWEDGTPPPHRDFKERCVVR